MCRISFFHVRIGKKINNSRAYSWKSGYAGGIIKKGQENPVKVHNFGFLPLLFANLGYLECYTPIFGGFSREKGIVRVPHAISGWNKPWKEKDYVKAL